MERAGGSPHVVVCPISASGHTTPFLQFARRLALAGVVTTIVSSDRHIAELERLVGSRDLTSQGEAPLRLLGLRDKKPDLSNAEWRKLLRNEPEEDLRVTQLLLELLADIASPASLQLRGVQPAAPPLCIISETTWVHAAADRLHIENHLLFVAPACALSCLLEAPRLFRDGRFPITRETRDTVVSDIPGLPPTRALDLPTLCLDASMSSSLMQTRYGHARRADVILLNTCCALEKPVLDAWSRNEGVGTPDLQAKYILEIGPLLPDFYEDDDGGDESTVQGLEERDACISWLNTLRENSVLFVSFGSHVTHSSRQLVDMALGLEASGASFLWIVRRPDAGEMSAASERPVSVMEYLPPGFQERVNGRGMCYSGWAPQMRILKHPAVGGFLSHCGWNSTLETLSAGVPVLAWPMNAEQHLTRRCLVDTLKVAIELKGNAYTLEELDSDVVRPVEFMSKEEIARKTRSLMQEAEGQLVRENIQELRTKCRESVAAEGPSRRNLETYIRLLHTIANLRSASHPSN